MKERRLIISVACGDKSRRFSDITFPLIQAYAKKCDADFLALYTEKPVYGPLMYFKWSYPAHLSSYDRILHIDADMVMKSTTPNLFDIVPPTHFAGVNEYPFQHLPSESPAVDRYVDLKLLGPAEPTFYINVGLYLFSSHHQHIFNKPPTHNPCYFKEQALINRRLSQSRNITLLPPAYNFMSIMENQGLDKRDAHIVHYAGSWGGLDEREIMKRMREDANEI